jgi:hypothetical protein
MREMLTGTYKWTILFILFSGSFCTVQDTSKPPQDFELASAWADLTNDVTRTTPANTPTFASRCFGYIGLTMYESIVPGYPEFNSVASQLNGLDSMPLAHQDSSYSWPLAMNASQAEILRLIYVQTGEANKARIDSLETVFHKSYSASINDEQLVRRSVRFGKAVAKRIFEWSVTDGGHRGYLRNFEKDRKFEDKPGGWKPALYSQSFSHHPLHPTWGENRCFLQVNDTMAAPAFITYDSTPGSAYYKQFLNVYNTERSLTSEQKEIAIWWGDDPDETPTPPGHSFYLASLVIRDRKPDLIHCAETYAKLGMAVSDAYRNCWKWKYMFFSERPNTFITEHIDQQWHSFWPDPPFPAFPSGHAIQAAASATVLTELYGNDFAFTDSIHANRNRDELRDTDFKVRHYRSFWQAAEETADSRFYGGIHTRQDNQKGLEKGKQIGENVNGLAWRKQTTK